MLSIECLHQHHSSEIGGYAIDLALRNKLASEFNTKYPGNDISTNKRAMMQLLVQAQKIKHVLSANNEIAFTMEQLHNNKDFKFKLNRSEFEQLITIDLTQGFAAITPGNELVINGNYEDATEVKTVSNPNSQSQFIKVHLVC